MSEIIPHQQTLPDVPAAAPAKEQELSNMLAVALESRDVSFIREAYAFKREYEADLARKEFQSDFAAWKSRGITIRKTTPNKQTGSKYADLHDICEAVVPTLAEHGISHHWERQDSEGVIEIRAVLTHRNGHRVEGNWWPGTVGSVRASDKLAPIWADASVVTYLERYSLRALLGLPEADDDGQSAAQYQNEPAVDERTEQILLGMQTAAEGGVLNEWYAKLEVDDRERISLPAYNRARLVNKEAQLAKAEDDSSDG